MRNLLNTYSLTIGTTYTDSVSTYDGSPAIGEPELAAIGDFNFCKKALYDIIASRKVERIVGETKPASGVLVVVTYTGYAKRCYIIEDMRYVAIAD